MKCERRTSNVELRTSKWKSTPPFFNSTFEVQRSTFAFKTVQIQDASPKILSPSDKQEDVLQKVQDYLDAGVPLVWLAEPVFKTITVYRPGGDPPIFGGLKHNRSRKRKLRSNAEPQLPLATTMVLHKLLQHDRLSDSECLNTLIRLPAYNPGMSVLAEKPELAVEPAAGSTAFDVDRLRAEFPILQTFAHGHPLVYLDNGATTQKPRRVIEAITRYYESENANIHRGVYELSQTATHLYEQARRKVARFINAAEDKEIIFTRGTTEGINLVAQTWGRRFLLAGDEIIISAMEHHSNIVPWQMLCEATGAVLRVIPMNDAGELLMDEYARLLCERTKLVAVCHLSNSLGTINDVKKIIKQAHAVGAKVLIDGAQWVAHYRTDVQDLDADFYVFSGHKLFGPTGIGVLYGKRALLEAMPPWQGGGDMIESVTFAKTAYAALPNKFEAGTPNIAGAVGLGAAIDFVSSLDFEAVDEHEQSLLDYATTQLQAVPGLRVIGTAAKKGSLISFVIDQPPIGSYDIGVALDRVGIAVRTGHHCCQPVMDRLNISATARASFALYNTRAEIDALAAALKQLVKQELARHPVPAAAAVQGEIRFPGPAADSSAAAAADLVELFDFLPDWDARMQELVGMGENLPPVPSDLKIECNRVHGCQSTVHLFGVRHGDRLDFVADSDAALVRGLIGILQRVYAGQRARDILEFDIEKFLRRLGLDSHLSMGRRNGLEGMIKKIRELASTIASQT